MEIFIRWLKRIKVYKTTQHYNKKNKPYALFNIDHKIELNATKNNYPLHHFIVYLLITR